MGKRRRKAGDPPVSANGTAPDDEREIAELRAALAPLIARGVSHFRLAAAAGVHPEDMKGFLEGRVSLTGGTRERLLASVPTIAVEKESPPGE